jgi:hypothetical protein
MRPVTLYIRAAAIGAFGADRGGKKEKSATSLTRLQNFIFFQKSPRTRRGRQVKEE